MKNNKGYYSWIHSLNEAAINSQQKSQRMLNEAKKLSHEQQAAVNIGKLLKDAGVPEESIKNALSQIMGVGREIAQNPQGLDVPESGDLGGWGLDRDEEATLRAAKAAEYPAPKARDSKPPKVDLTGDGDVDGEDAEAKVTFANSIETGIRPPSFPWAHDAENEELEQEQNDRLRELKQEADEELRHLTTPDENTVIINVKEELNNKIQNMLNETTAEDDALGEVRRARRSGRPIRGTKTPGAVSPVSTFGELPPGFTKGGEEPFGKILKVLQDPSKHPKGHVDFARQAMDAIRKVMKED